MATYDIGNKIRVTGTFTNPLSGDAAVDPTTVFCTVQNPNGVKIDYQYNVGTVITKSSTGNYYMDVPLSTTGRWYIRWWGRDTAGKDSVAEEITIMCAAHVAT